MTMKTPTPFKIIQRRTTIAIIMLNFLGALVSVFYFNVIDPLPTGHEPLRAVDRTALIISGALVLLLLIAGFVWGRKSEACIAEWYERLRNGAPAVDVPMNVRRDVLTQQGEAQCWQV